MKELKAFEEAFYAWAFGDDQKAKQLLGSLELIPSEQWAQTALIDAPWCCTGFGRLMAFHAPQVLSTMTPMGYYWLYERSMWSALSHMVPQVQKGLLHLVEYLPDDSEQQELISAYPTHLREEVERVWAHEEPQDEDYFEAFAFLAYHKVQPSQRLKEEAESV